MSSNHFKFYLIPKSSALLIHDGRIPKHLPNYREYNGKGLPEGVFENYWKGSSIADIEETVKIFLPLIDSWNSARVYGVKYGSKVEIDNEDVLVKLDAFSINLDLQLTVIPCILKKF